MTDIINKSAGTSASLALVGLVGIASINNTANLSWQNIQLPKNVYTISTSSTYWTGGDYTRSRRVFKRFKFLKRGRSRPAINHDYFMTFWG